MALAVDKVRVSIYIPESIKSVANEIAESEKRSLSNWVELAMEEAIKKAQKVST